MWYAARGGLHTAFKADNKFNSVMTNFNIGFHPENKENVVLTVGEDGGHGVMERLAVNQAISTDDTYKTYMIGTYY